MNPYTKQDSRLYADLPVASNTYELAYNQLKADIGSLEGLSVLDFGCGPGRSIKVIEDLKPSHIVGVDKNQQMLSLARDKDYIVPVSFRNVDSLVQSSKQKIDVAICAHVLVEQPTLSDLLSVCRMMTENLKIGGKACFIVTNPDAYNHSFISFDLIKAPKTKVGDPVIVRIHAEPSFDITDYYWDEETYESVFTKSGLAIEKKSKPRPTNPESKEWRDETIIAPNIVYLCTKTA